MPHPTHTMATRPRRPISDIALIAVFAAFIAACSVLAIPIGAVPVTLQTFAVLLSGAVLGASRGFFAVLLYLAIGAIGLPVFAGGSAGLAPFAGASAGYLISFPLAALLTGLLVRALPRRTIGASTVTVFGSALISTLFITYPMGIIGLSWRAGLTLGEAFTINLAFIPLDLAKIALVAIVATSVHRAFPSLFPPRIHPTRGSKSTTDPKISTAPSRFPTPKSAATSKASPGAERVDSETAELPS